MPQRVVIVGGGVGGTIVANVLARTLGSDEAEITVIDSTGNHTYMPGWLYIPFNGTDGVDLSRPERSLLNSRVKLFTGQVSHIDTKARTLEVRSAYGSDSIGGTGGAQQALYHYDYLVLATGARLATDDLTGLSEGVGAWHDFYSLEGALRLRTALHNFEGGRIVLAIGGIPYRCPPAPLEFVFLLEDWLRQRGIRDRTEIEYLYPLPRVFPIESVAEVATPLLEQRGIKYQVFFNTDEVDTEHRIVRSLEGDDVNYDLLVVVPPHRGARAIEEAGLGDEQGWIPTARDTLEVKGQEGVFALGDATDLPISKSGSAAHFQAKVVAARIVAAVRGEAPDPHHATYEGDVMCFLETGHNTATQLVFDYEHPPKPPRPSLYYHMEKQLFNRAYWYIVPQGLV
ncbi:MAG TPA: FAD/NAD(P)-binding oxidoreductase [Ktedonobacterales bacterium]